MGLTFYSLFERCAGLLRNLAEKERQGLRKLPGINFPRGREIQEKTIQKETLSKPQLTSTVRVIWKLLLSMCQLFGVVKINWTGLQKEDQRSIIKYSKHYRGSKWNEVPTVCSYRLCPEGPWLRNLCNWHCKRRCNKVTQEELSWQIIDQVQALDRCGSDGRIPPEWEYPIHRHGGGQDLFEK